MTDLFASVLGPSARRVALVACLSMTLLACSSPEETANKYYEKGLAQLEKGELIKADEEFRNALKINDKLVKPWFGLVLVAEKQNDVDKQFRLLSTVVNLDPKHLEAQLKLGRLLVGAGKLDAALKTSDLTLALNKDSPDVLALRATVMYRLDDKAAALELANSALAKQPDNVDALQLLAADRLAAKDVAQASSYLDRGLKKDKNHIGLSLLKVQVLLEQQQRDAAEQVFRQLVAAHPDVRNLRHLLVRFYLGFDQKDKAEVVLREIAKQHPEDLTSRLDVVRFVQASRGGDAAVVELNNFIAADASNDRLKFALVDLYLALKKVDDAKKMLAFLQEKAIEEADKLKANAMLAELALKQGDVVAARKMVVEILEVDKRHVAALILQARMAIDERKLDQAIADLRTVLRDSPNSAPALLLLARAHEMTGAFDLAQEHYHKAFEAAKGDLLHGVPYVEFLLRRGKADRALKVAEEVFRINRNNATAIRLLAQARIANGDAVGAQAIADQLRKAEQGEAIADQIMGALYASQKDYGKSIAAFQRATEAAPADASSMLGLVGAYLQSGKTAEAIAFLQSVISASPSNSRAMLLLAQVYVQAAKPNEARQAFQKVLALDAKQIAAYIGLVGLEISNNNLTEAQRVLERGLQVAPNNLELQANQAQIYELSGRYDQAIQVYERLVRENPGIKLLVNNLASLLADHRTDKVSLDKAYDLSKKLQDSEVPYFKDTVAWVHYRRGKPQEALEPLKSAIKQLPGQPVMHYHLGMVYLALGDKVAARQELNRALELAKGKTFADLEKVKQALSGL